MRKAPEKSTTETKNSFSELGEAESGGQRIAETEKPIENWIMTMSCHDMCVGCEEVVTECMCNEEKTEVVPLMDEGATSVGGQVIRGLF